MGFQKKITIFILFKKKKNFARAKFFLFQQDLFQQLLNKSKTRANFCSS
jgi:hypothetical protein